MESQQLGKFCLPVALNICFGYYIFKTLTNGGIMLVQEIKMNNGERLEIHQDGHSFNPREEFDNVTEMIFFHKRMNVGDNHNIDPDNYSSFSGMMQENTEEGDLAMTVYCYSKRCFELSLSRFDCPWDSGVLGFIVVRKSVIDHEFDGDREKALRNLKAELRTYNDYINGRTYGGILYDAQGEEIDSCWGFYGNDFEENGIYDNFGINKNNIVEVA